MRGFYTKSGRSSSSLPVWPTSLTPKADRSTHLPVYAPRDWQPDDAYRCSINWKEASHTHTRTQNNPWLLEIKPDNPLIVHPTTAERFGFSDGDEVWVESPYGKVMARAKVTQRIHPEVVGLQHGFGHTALGATPKAAAPETGYSVHQGRRTLRDEPAQGGLRHASPHVVSRA